MDVLKDRRVLALGGMAIALVAGLIVAFVLVRRPNASAEAPPASEAGLVVQTGRDDDTKLDPMRPLRCFVAGQFVGELPLSACAKRNGVATGALDVGLDPSGALAGSSGTNSDITPLPPRALGGGDRRAHDAHFDGGGFRRAASTADATGDVLALRRRGSWTPLGRECLGRRLRRNPVRGPMRATRWRALRPLGRSHPASRAGADRGFER